MAAGVGSRLEPLTLACPKPLAPINNIPVMQYNIDALKRAGITNITANLHAFPEKIKEYFKDGKEFGVNLTYSDEKVLLGTAGGVKKMSKVSLFDDEYFIVLSADVYTDIDLDKLISFHKEKKAMVTIALIEIEDTTQFGVVITDDNGKIKSFQEKPKKEEALSHFANTGVYIMNKEVLDLIPNNTFYDFGKELFPLLVKNDMPFYAMKTNAYWIDIGTIANYKRANFDLVGTLHRNVHGNSNIIGHNVIIGKDVKISDSIIWDNVTIEDNVEIEDSIIGADCHIRKGVCIAKNSVIANGCTINSSLPENSRIKPNLPEV